MFLLVGVFVGWCISDNFLFFFSFEVGGKLKKEGRFYNFLMLRLINDCILFLCSSSFFRS